MTEEQLAELEALANAATPGPWNYDGMHDEIIAPRSGDYWIVLSECRTAPDETPVDRFGHQFCHDFAFIAASRAAVPELIAEVRRLRDLLVRCRPYMRHTPLCNNCIYGIECDCGHDAILEELDGWVKAAKVGGE
jgi:hypothetical protein